MPPPVEAPPGPGAKRKRTRIRGKVIQKPHHGTEYGKRVVAQLRWIGRSHECGSRDEAHPKPSKQNSGGTGNSVSGYFDFLDSESDLGKSSPNCLAIRAPTN